MLTADRGYIKDRDSCIPDAVRFTNNSCGSSFLGDKADGKARDEWNRHWTRTFMERMDYLYYELVAARGKEVS